MAIFGPNLLTFQLCLCSASLTIRVLIPLFNGTYLFQIGKKMPEVRGRRPRRFEKTLDQLSIPSSDRKQILPSPLHGDRTKANRMPCILSKDQPSDRASNAQNACPPQAFLEKLARFPHSLIRTSPPPSSIRGVASTPKPRTTLWFVTPPGNPSPAFCRVDVGVQMAKTVLPHTGSAKAGLAPRGLVKAFCSLRHCTRRLCHGNCPPRCTARSRRGVEKRPLFPLFTGLLHLFRRDLGPFLPLRLVLNTGANSRTAPQLRVRCQHQ